MVHDSAAAQKGIDRLVLGTDFQGCPLAPSPSVDKTQASLVLYTRWGAVVVKLTVTLSLKGETHVLKCAACEISQLLNPIE